MTPLRARAERPKCIGRRPAAVGPDRIFASRRRQLRATHVLDWQVHIFGEAIPEIRALCAEHHLALHEFAWQRAMTRAGLERDALYLVRPDGYIAFASQVQSAEALDQYLDRRRLKLGADSGSRPVIV